MDDAPSSLAIALGLIHAMTEDYGPLAKHLPEEARRLLLQAAVPVLERLDAQSPVKAIVLRGGADAALASEFFPGWKVVRVGEPLAGRRFARVVMLAAPDPHYEGWLDELHLKLSSGVCLEWLA